MRVFIGTSSAYVKKKPTGGFELLPNSPLEPIIVALIADGHDVVPWWNDDYVKLWEYFLDSLIAASRTCDLGIFIFGADDPLKEDDKIAPRDNVILECGMFLAVNGKQNTCIIIDNVLRQNKFFWNPSIKEPKIPSDLAGLKLANLSDSRIAEKIVNHFRKSRNKHSLKRTFYFNESIINKLIKKEYQDWGTKALYVGIESSRLWKDIEKHSDYKDYYKMNVLDKFVKKFTKEPSQEQKKVDFKKIDNVLSLGPGCGIVDNIVIEKVYNVNPIISYIPIDINPYLAFEAMELINKRPKLRTPFAIIDDFEDNSEYIGDIINEKIHSIKQSNFFMMLGGTFCNLSGTENSIFEKFEYWMEEGDYFLLDAFIISDDYDFKVDIERQPATMPDTYKNFIINSLMKKYAYCLSNGLKAENSYDNLLKDLKDNFSKYIKVDTEGASYTKTNLDSTHIATYQFTKNKIKNAEVLVAKRYKYEELKEYISVNDTFDLVDCHNGFDDDILGEEQQTMKSRGLFLFKKEKLA